MEEGRRKRIKLLIDQEYRSSALYYQKLRETDFFEGSTGMSLSYFGLGEKENAIKFLSEGILKCNDKGDAKKMSSMILDFISINTPPSYLQDNVD